MELGFYLSVFVQDVSKEAVGVGEALRASTFPHTDHSVLLRMQNAALKYQNAQIKIQRQEILYRP